MRTVADDREEKMVERSEIVPAWSLDTISSPSVVSKLQRSISCLANRGVAGGARRTDIAGRGARS